jgi:hypothetical protein
MANIIYPPNKREDTCFTIFLAGTIDNGAGPEWQQEVCREFKDYMVNFMNPRRLDWNNSVDPAKHGEWLEEQVNWELKHLENADLVVMFIAAGSKSVISLLELGLICKNPNVVVCCEDGFYRKGNVDIVCRRYRTKQVATFADLIAYIRGTIRYLTLTN